MDNDFSNYMTDVMNKSSLAIMLSIGHRTKLFDVLSTLPPSTIKEIASKSNLNERYVKEWLGAMVTAKIIDYDSNCDKFSLPKEKSVYLTRENNIYNFAASMQWIPILSQVEDEIIECFAKGGGVPYSSYKRFHEVMAEESNQTVVVGLVDHILPLVPNLIADLKSGITVLDIGYGYDFSEEAIDSAMKEGRDMNNSNVFFKVHDILNLRAKDKFDLIIAFDAIHDQPKPDLVLQNIYQSLSHKGVFLMQDILASTPLKDNISHPLGTFLYTISCMHCMTVSLSQNGAGLGAMWGKEKAVSMLKEAGFDNIEVKTLPHDFQNYYYIACKDK
jgi:SAM-dependent methyltransferase